MNLYKETLYSFARYFAALLFGFIIAPLIANNVITADLGEKLQGTMENAIGLFISTLLLFIAPLLLSWWNKVVAKAKVMIALQLDPKHSDLAGVERRADEMKPKATLKKATLEQPLPEGFK